MIDQETITKLNSLCHKPVALGGWLGTPYNPDKGCYRFVVQFYHELGITLHPEHQLRAFRDFVDVKSPQFADAVIFYYRTIMSWHVGIMLDSRHMVQSGELSNGVGITTIDRYPWIETFWGFLRHKSLCF